MSIKTVTEALFRAEPCLHAAGSLLWWRLLLSAISTVGDHGDFVLIVPGILRRVCV